MSSKSKDKRQTDVVVKQEEKIRMSLSNIIENINNNNLTYFYPKDESLFKKRIDKLNLKFYIETEKYLTNKNDMERCQDQLFIILFKQISLYIEEVERLNYLIREKQEDEKTFKEKIEEMQKREREKSSTQLLINNLKTSNKNLEKKLEEKTKIDNKLKTENVSLQRQIKFYQEKLQIDLKKNQDIYFNNVGRKRKNLDELNNSNINIVTNNDLNNTNFRSNSKESTHKASFCVTSNTQNTNCNSVSFNSNSIVTNDLQLDTVASNQINTAVNSSINNTSQTPSNAVQSLNPTNRNFLKQNSKIFSDNLSLSKILNKKRNYSDNNPSQVKKGVNIVSVSINNRYGDLHLAKENLNAVSGIKDASGSMIQVSVNEMDKFKREITKSSNVPKNNMKSPKRNDDVSPINNIANNNCNNVNITLNNAVNNTQNFNTNINNIQITNGFFINKDINNKELAKKYASDSKYLSKNISNNYKDFKIIKSIKQSNKKTDSQDKSIIEPLKSPKGSNNGNNINFDQSILQPNITSQPLSTCNNENNMQDLILNSFNSLEEEINYLNELEKMLKGAKQLMSNNNEVEFSNLDEIYRRTDNNEHSHTFVFSDEENDGYKSGSSLLSDKPINISKKNLQESKTNVSIVSSSSKNPKIKSFPSVTIDLINGEKAKNNLKSSSSKINLVNKFKK